MTIEGVVIRLCDNRGGGIRSCDNRGCGHQIVIIVGVAKPATSHVTIEGVAIVLIGDVISEVCGVICVL